jgi:hypothetical protein
MGLNFKGYLKFKPFQTQGRLTGLKSHTTHTTKKMKFTCFE